MAPAVVSIASAPRKVFEEKYVLSGENAGINTNDETLLEASGGSGFIVSEDGIILTNKHVVSDDEPFDSTQAVQTPSGLSPRDERLKSLRARRGHGERSRIHEKYFVTLPDERKFPVKILAKDPTGDLAIIKIDAKNLPVAPLGTAKKLALGEEVIAIGNAYGQFTNTASAGIISGLSRSLMAQLDDQGRAEELFGLIQTDAAINPGNSGGPLVNMDGEVIGINVAMIVGAQSLSFAVPIDTAIKDLEELKRFGHIRKPYLGIKYLPINEMIKGELGLSVNAGALISSRGHKEEAVTPGSPADTAGLRKGDVIVAVNGQNINQHEPFGAHLMRAKVGTAIILTILRENRKKDVAVQVAEWDSSDEEK